MVLTTAAVIGGVIYFTHTECNDDTGLRGDYVVSTLDNLTISTVLANINEEKMPNCMCTRPMNIERLLVAKMVVLT